jgi:hypothetical protein
MTVPAAAAELAAFTWNLTGFQLASARTAATG